MKRKSTAKHPNTSAPSTTHSDTEVTEGTSLIDSEELQPDSIFLLKIKQICAQSGLLRGFSMPRALPTFEQKLHAALGRRLQLEGIPMASKSRHEVLGSLTQMHIPMDLQSVNDDEFW